MSLGLMVWHYLLMYLSINVIAPLYCFHPFSHNNKKILTTTNKLKVVVVLMMTIKIIVVCNNVTSLLRAARTGTLHKRAPLYRKIQSLRQKANPPKTARGVACWNK